MTPSNRSIALGISLFLWLPATAPASAEEIATAAELAQLTSSQRELQAKLDVRLGARVEVVIEENVNRYLEDRTMQLLLRRTRHAARQDDGPPAAIPAGADDQPSDTAQPAPNTTCKMVGRTLDCVLRDVASR